MRFLSPSRLPIVALALAGLVVGFVPGSAPAQEPRPQVQAAASKLPRMMRLSDERLRSQWAYPAARGTVFRDPKRGSPRVGRLRLYTEDRLPEVYLVLRQYTDVKGREWAEIRVPKRPNGRVGWVRREALGPYNTNTQQLVINRATLRATLYHRGSVIWSAPVGVGASATKTPAGRFYVREKFRFKNAPVYGTRAIGTSAYAPSLSDWPGGGVIGIHGTNEPALIPGRVSHGCVRVRNRDIARLYRLIELGTPILVR